MNVTLNNGSNTSVPFMTSESDYLPALQTATSSVNLALVFPTNAYVLWLILSGAGGTIASEFFHLNLTVSVMIFSLVSALHFVRLFTRHFFLDVIIRFAICLFLSSVPSFQCCVCVERYVAVVHPVAFLRYKPLRYRVACCCAVWLTVLALSLGDMFVSRHVFFDILLGSYVALVSVMSFCCLSVLRALRRPGPGEGQRDSGVGTDMKRRAFKIILISLIVMLLTYLPYVVTTPLGHCRYFSEEAFGLVITITYTIVMMSGFVHPLLYLHRAGKLPCCKGF